MTKLQKIRDGAEEMFKWGAAGLGLYHIVLAVFGKDVPDDSPSGIAKAVKNGGLFSSDDQVAMDEIEEELRKDLFNLIQGFYLFVRDGFGTGITGRIAAWYYMERFRSFVVRMRTPEQGNKKAVDFLSRLAEAIKAGGNEGGVKFLHLKSYPVPRFSIVKTVDDGFNKLPKQAQTAGRYTQVSGRRLIRNRRIATGKRSIRMWLGL